MKKKLTYGPRDTIIDVSWAFFHALPLVSLVILCYDRLKHASV